MKQVINGKLAYKPEIKEVSITDGSKAKLVNFTIFAFDPQAPVTEKDGKSVRKGIPLKCTAWGENAEYISNMEKGKTLTAVANMRLNEYDTETNHISEPIYVIKRIDKNNEIHKQMTELLKGYEEERYDIIYSNDMQQPSFSKDRDNELNTDYKKTVEPEKEEEKGK